MSCFAVTRAGRAAPALAPLQLLLLLASLLPTAWAVPQGLQATLKQLAAEESKKYNCSISIAYRDASGLALAAGGFVDGSGNRPASVNDSYAFGSVTKVLTGASVLRLVAQGELSLDDEVAPLVDPLLAAMADADPQQGFRSLADLWGASNVTGTTLRQLLGMRSGVPDFDTATPCFNGTGSSCVPRDPLRKTLYDDPAHGYSPTKLMGVPWVRNRWRPCNRSIIPGMKPFCYSSTNFMLLGLVLAARAGDSSWNTLDQAAYLPEDLKNALTFAMHGSPQDYTLVHGFDRTSYNMAEGKHNDHDNWKVSGVFSGWTASDIVATPAAVANLTWEVYGPPRSIVPEEYLKLMIPEPQDIYGLATFNLGRNTGQTGKYGIAYGHLGATYGYQSVTGYFPTLNFALTVASNIERDYQEQPADTMCHAYNIVAGLMLNRTLTCKFGGGGYYGGCVCDPIEGPRETSILV